MGSIGPQHIKEHRPNTLIVTVYHEQQKHEQHKTYVSVCEVFRDCIECRTVAVRKRAEPNGLYQSPQP